MTTDTTRVPKVIEVEEIPTCFLCGEKASGQNSDGIDLCDIKGNHPDYDNDKLIPFIVVPVK